MKYLFFDLDGTLLDSFKNISAFTVEALRRLKEDGYVIGVSSGRAMTGIEPVIRDIETLVDVIVCNCGADLYEKERGVLEHFHPIPKQTIDLFLDTFRGVKDLYVVFRTDDRFYASGVHPTVELFRDANNFSSIHDPSEGGYTSTQRIELVFPVKETQEEVYRHILTKDFPGMTGYHSDSFIYEYVDSRNSKGNAIRICVERRGDSLDDVLCMGDSPNDIEMIEMCGLGVAMKNAEEAVKDAADEVTEYTNDEDGAARYLLKKIYGEE